MCERIGIFLCTCGRHINNLIELERIIERAKQNKNVIIASQEPYICIEQGQIKINQAIKAHNLDGLLIAACGDLREIDLEEQCRVEYLDLGRIIEDFRNRSEATQRAAEAVERGVEKLLQQEMPFMIEIPVIKKALVIGGGIAGMQAALDIANAGYEVYLVEKLPSIGGKMAQLSETFPTLDCTQCILTPKMVEVKQHENIKLLVSSEIEEVTGYVGNFSVKIRRKATYVNEKCTACGDCAQVCPVEVPNEFDLSLSARKAIYLPFPQAVPAKYTIDLKHCIRCYRCIDACGDRNAIDFSMQDEIIEIQVGAIIVATGYELMPLECFPEYGYGRYEDVIDSLEFERLLSASGPTRGEILRPSDGKVPRDVVFIQCVGSRDSEHGVPYCSRVCCMFTAKHAMLFKHRVSDGQAYVFYMDVRAFGKGYEEFVKRAVEEDRVLYIRGRVSRVFEEDGKLIVWGFDTLSGEKIEVKADLVVLATAILPSRDARDLARKLRIATDEYGFLTEAHPKLRPLESLTPGIFLAGTAQAPRDIPDTVAHASGAASRVIVVFSRDTIRLYPSIEIEKIVKPSTIGEVEAEE
ncbi:MAG: CoB--CoM heterodisulfide reductase iron-sulfur subunit A family protein [Methanocellales archaeon]